MCGYAFDGVRFQHSDDRFTLVSGQKCNQAFSGNAANCERKLGSTGVNSGSLSLASELHQHTTEKTHTTLTRGLFDDESYVVRQGTGPSLLIATAAGLEAFIPNGDAASLKVEQIQEWVAVPERRKKPRSVIICVQVSLGVDNLFLPQS